MLEVGRSSLRERARNSKILEVIGVPEEGGKNTKQLGCPTDAEPHRSEDEKSIELRLDYRTE